MSIYYLSEKDVEESIDYFKNTEFDGTLALSYYLGFRHFGLSMKNAVTIGTSQMSTDYKDNYVDTWVKMFSLIDNTENTEMMFGIAPFDLKSEIKKSNLYNPGTPFNKSRIAGRPKDSLKNLVRTVEFVDYQGDYIYSTRRTPEIIQNSCLKDNKISLKHFASWFFRFYGFKFDNSEIVSNLDFSRVVKKTIVNYFKLSKNDFTWLFEDDILNNSFEISDTAISGEWIRSRFVFSTDTKDLIDSIKQVDSGEALVPSVYNSLSNEKVVEYLKLVGDNPSDETILATLRMKKQMVLTGVPGTGKSRFLDSIKNDFYKSEMIQFHANYSYEDFIGGETLVNGTIETRMGVFLAFCHEAEKFPEKDFLFIIDELNRGNIAQIFGETILTLDRSYNVNLARPIKIKENGSDVLIDRFQIPQNVYIAASMNTADRNIAFLDLAIRRRFAFVEITPNYEVVSALAEYRDFDLGNILKTINNSILNTLNKEELLLGQSYFLNESVYNDVIQKYVWTEEYFQFQFNYVILPTLKEYTFSDKNALVTILGNDLSSGILDTEDFVKAFHDFF